MDKYRNVNETHSHQNEFTTGFTKQIDSLLIRTSSE